MTTPSGESTEQVVTDTSSGSSSTCQVVEQNAVRIDIRHASHAKAYGKLGKQLILKHLNAPTDSHLPTQVTRNAICQGFGYSSYNQVVYISSNPNRALPAEPSDEQLFTAFTRGFGLALEVARRYGFTSQTSPKALIQQLALEAIEIIRARRTQRAIERESHNHLLPGEILADDDLASRIATVSRRFTPGHPDSN